MIYVSQAWYYVCLQFFQNKGVYVFSKYEAC